MRAVLIAVVLSCAVSFLCYKEFERLSNGYQIEATKYRSVEKLSSELSQVSSIGYSLYVNGSLDHTSAVGYKSMSMGEIVFSDGTRLPYEVYAGLRRYPSEIKGARNADIRGQSSLTIDRTLIETHLRGQHSITAICEGREFLVVVILHDADRFPKNGVIAVLVH